MWLSQAVSVVCLGKDSLSPQGHRWLGNATFEARHGGAEDMRAVPAKILQGHMARLLDGALLASLLPQEEATLQKQTYTFQR